MVRSPGGKVVGDADSVTESDMTKRGSGDFGAKLQAEADGNNVAAKFLRATGLDLSAFEPSRTDRLADLPGARREPNNTAFRWNMVWSRTVQDYPGSIDELNLTLDVVTGKVINFRGPDGTE